MDFEYKILLELDLQMFAKDGEGGEKTEDATAKKLDEVRKEGNVAKSREIVTCTTLFGLYICMRFLMGFVGNHLLRLFDTFYILIPRITKEGLTITNFNSLYMESMKDFIIVLLPFFISGVVISLISNYSQFKFQVTSKPLEPKLNKINPASGFKRMFSMNSIMELVKALVKIFFISYIAYGVFTNHMNDLFLLYDMSLKQGILLMYDVILELLLKICMLFVVIAAADFLYQKWKFKEDNKMTKQEVKDEYKNTEGDPHIKGQQKQRMRQASQRRMMDAIPEADVVITNPTHFAVALAYKSGDYQAPIVVAKGADFLASKIKEIAKDNHVEIVENKQLARMLYYNVDLDAEIPPELYSAVAEVLAYVYQLKNAG